jgi:hypothetical protein
MQWIWVGLVGILERIFSWFIGKGIKSTALFLSYSTFIIGGFIAFIALSYAAINALRPVVPFGVDFGLSLLPSQTPLYISAYLTVLIARRVYDLQKRFTRDFTQATLKF